MSECALCPQCRTPIPPDRLGGLCPACFARGALNGAAGWLAESAPAPDDAWPDISGWTLTGVLGAGGMGKVYRGESVADGTIAALKILDARWCRDPLMAARFEAEAGALTKLEHPHIVRQLDMTETDDGRLCLVMEYVDGCDLSRLLRAGKLPPERAMDIFRKVCAAAAHAHSAGFVHRDIKPSNILVSADDVVKLADFGLVKSLASDTSGPLIGGLTATTDQFGTAYYLAPERMTGAPDSGARGDVYALGVLLYHLLTGRMPLGKFQQISAFTDLPAAMDAVVAGALEADPAARTASAERLAADAAKVWQAHLAGTVRRREWKRAAIAAAAVAVIAGAAWGGAAWQRTQRPEPVRFPDPALASTGNPFTNSLGMKFVPVPGTGVLFCTHETRRRDYDPYREADRSAAPWRSDRARRLGEQDASIIRFTDNGVLHQDDSYEQPAYPVTPDHPAHGIGIRDAQHFCVWLTIKDHAAGRIGAGWHYRLPTGAEWLTACGGEEAPRLPGNIAGPEVIDYPQRPADWPMLPERDDFLYPAPVASFPAERHGLHDMSGNLSEWVQDEPERTGGPAVQSAAFLLGPNYIQAHRGADKLSFRSRVKLASRQPHVGFRVVLESPGLDRPEPTARPPQ